MPSRPPNLVNERMQDEPELESQKEEHQSTVYEQTQRYRASKAVLRDI